MNNLITASAHNQPCKFILPADLTASQATATDDDTTTEENTRELSGLVLPFNKPGKTNRGVFSVNKDAIELPEDLGRVKLYRDHSNDNGTPVGRATAAEVKDDGIHMSFHVGATADGDAALADVTEGIRDALSVELDDPEITDGVVTAARLTAVALVALPAYDDARVTAAAGKPRNLASTVSTHINASKHEEKTMNLTKAANTIVTGMTSADHSDITAALGEITNANNPAVDNVQWLGELWKGARFQRQIIPTLSSQPLTGIKLRGWRWKTLPTVDDYAGNLQEIPTNSPATEAIEVEAKRIAGGHKLDRKYIDFPDAGFIQSYLAEMTNSYAMKSDEKAADFVVAEAKKKKEKTKQPNLLHAAAKARQIIKKQVRMEPTAFLVNPDDLFKLMDITTMDNPEYLKLLGVDPEKFIADDKVPANSVIAYHKDAITFGELPGSPIRVNAVDVARGGSDHALFGYWAAFVSDARGIVQVEFNTATTESAVAA